MEPTSAILIVLTVFIIYYLVKNSGEDGMTARGRPRRPTYQGPNVGLSIPTDYIADGESGGLTRGDAAIYRDENGRPDSLLQLNAILSGQR